MTSPRCPECKNYNKIIETEIIVPQREQPFYLGIVPEAPRKISGLLGKKTDVQIMNRIESDHDHVGTKISGLSQFKTAR